MARASNVAGVGAVAAAGSASASAASWAVPAVACAGVGAVAAAGVASASAASRADTSGVLRESFKGSLKYVADPLSLIHI